MLVDVRVDGPDGEIDGNQVADSHRSNTTLNMDRSNIDKPSQEGNLPIHNVGQQGPLDARNPVNCSDPAN